MYEACLIWCHFVLVRYAADGSRGGVLEANGAASIKFRDKDLLRTGTALGKLWIYWEGVPPTISTL